MDEIMKSKICKFCGHSFDAPTDNRSMDRDPVNYGIKIVEFLLREGFTFGDIDNYCYAHVSLFKHTLPGTYEGMRQRSKKNRITK